VLAALWRADGPDAVGRYCWHAMAWARLARVDPDPARRDQWRALGYEHAGAVIARQWRPGQAGYFPAYLGSAKNARPPRTAPTSARAESLYENYLAARFANDDDAAREFAGALSASMRFVIANQYSRENTYFLPHPERAIGGIRGGLAAGDIRIDYNQHALYAMMGLLNSMNAEH
ncbi:hypothetical protein K8I61_18205, partial [bacterium]|nr:hypothetical protein [bacterium]